MDFLNADLLSKLAGVAGLCLSLFLAVSEHFKNRQNFELSVLDYTEVRYVTQFFVSIVNKSKTPLVITEISFHGTPCELEPKKIRGEPGDWNSVTTPRFPLHIPANSAQFFYLEFLYCAHTPLIADTWVTFQIHTISQQAIKTVLLPCTAYYLHIK